MIDVENISISFEKKVILSGFSFAVKYGENVCITGSSGKGKTSLLKTIPGLIPIGSGQIIVNSKVLHESTVESIRNDISWLPQDINLPVKSIHELCSDFLEFTDFEYLFHIISIFHLEKELLHQEVSTLSPGQKQRILLALCLSLRKPLLLLDEPTSALNPELIDVIIHYMKELKSTTIVSVSHNKDWINSCDKIIEL